ncbi:sulfated surface glycoprotein 185-like isoform X2 [Tripterygium wilfordii]|uniref:sulfated surface glycoprotein 185-like isoform X2 n=1 Tax=Tripterygium wilfordii TaxID=458696 RepID=UPI0018F81AFC|nr:sulfated surface glycoprotein 185-like isoform X2 [Tripterygium wilfordii]
MRKVLQEDQESALQNPSPEKIKKKICCKGGDSVKCIEIVPEKKPEKPKPAPPPPEKPKPAPPPPEKPKPTPPPPEKPKPAPPPPEKPKPAPPPPEKPKPAPPPPEKPPQPVPQPCPVYPPAFPIGVCCVECYGGRGGGPCYQGYGYPPRVYDGYCGTPVYDSWGGGGYPVSRCGESSSICSIM